MSDRYPGYLFGGTPVSSWDRSFNSLENQIQQQYLGRHGVRRWGSMSEGGACAGRTNLIVNYLPQSVAEKDLYAMFTSVGPVESCRVMKDFKCPPAVPSSPRAPAACRRRTNLIVNYLPQSVAEKDLYAMFTSVGPVESCRVMKDFKTGYSYGFGFVNFAREEDAARAIDTFNGYQLRNKRLKVSYARPSGDDIKDTNLYVTNLPRAITEEQLETIFGKYGRIVQKHILRDKNNGTPRGVAFVRDKNNGTPLGVAFIRYDKREEAQEAIAALNNVIPEGGTEPLSVKVAEEHGKQKAAYYAGWAAGFHHNRGDYAWNSCNGCVGPDMWDPFPSPPLGGSHPSTPRSACRPPPCPNTRAYPNYLPGKGPRPGRGGRNPPWAPGFDERYKPQRCRSGPTPYW